MFTFAIGNKLPLNEAAQLSNVAAGIAIEHLGCARVSLTELARRLLEYECFRTIISMHCSKHSREKSDIIKYFRRARVDSDII